MSGYGAILAIDLTSNTSDEQLLANLRATALRGLPALDAARDVVATPILLCGSGPSLDDYFPIVRLMYPNAPIMALNGAYNHIRDKFGVTPEYFAMLDARDCNAAFVERMAPETTCLIASQVHPSVFDALKDHEKTLVFHLNAPHTKEVFPNAKLYFGSAGGTIGGTAPMLCCILGHPNIALLGYDSSYKADKSHAFDQPQNKGQNTIPVYLNGKEYIATPNMAKQVEQFRRMVVNLTKIYHSLDIRMFGEGLLYDYLAFGNTNEPTTETEARKYSELYESDDYGMPESRQKVVRDLLSARNVRGSLLDVGTGRGETMRIARDLGYDPVAGTETVPALCNDDVQMALLPTLDHLSGSYDTVTCFEVIEHLLPKDVIPALRELARVAKYRVILSVCTEPDIRGGCNLHPSFRTKEEWERTLKAAWGKTGTFTHVGNASPLGYSPVYELVLF